MSNTGHLYFIMGTSGSGKGTLINNLKESSDIGDVYMPLSYKSREKRDDEVDGIDAHFVSHGEFEVMIKNNEFLEYELVYGHDFYYGTSYSEVVKDGIEKRKKVMKEVDMEGLKKTLKNFPKLKKDITSIFLDLSEDRFSERIQSRGEIMDKIAFEKRLISFQREKRDALVYCDYIIDTSNKTPEEVLIEVKKILQK